MDPNVPPPLNPWLSIWTRPRDTIEAIVSSDPRRLVLLLAALGGFANALDRASLRDLGDKYDLPVIFGLSAIGGPIGGIVALYVGGALIRWTGTWIGGRASTENIRAAIAWSNVPLIWALLLWIPEALLLGDGLFKSEAPALAENSALALGYLGLVAVQFVIGIWTIVVFLKCLGQVQGFSAWKALGNSLLAALAIVVPILVVTFAVRAIA